MPQDYVMHELDTVSLEFSTIADVQAELDGLRAHIGREQVVSHIFGATARVPRETFIVTEQMINEGTFRKNERPYSDGDTYIAFMIARPLTESEKEHTKKQEAERLKWERKHYEQLKEKFGDK